MDNLVAGAAAAQDVYDLGGQPSRSIVNSPKQKWNQVVR
jgi:hypothetical protein